MNFLQRWAGRVFRLTDLEPWSSVLGGTGTHSGKNITADAALGVSTAWACMRLLSETVGSLPIDVLRKEGENNRKDPGHWSYWMMREQPNEDMTPVQFKEALTLNLLAHGNAYADISNRNGAGQVSSMIPLLSELMQPERLDDGTIIYRYHTGKGPDLIYSRDDILHVPGFGFNGLIGLNPINYNRQALGLTLAAEEFGARFFKQGMKYSGILVSPQALNSEQRKKLRERYEEFQEGVESAHKLLILEAAFEFHPLTIPPEQAQFLETRKFQENEVCRIFLVPPHMVMNLDRATFSNIEHQDLQFGKYTLRPYLTRIEQNFKKSLLRPEERRTFKFEFNMNAIFRADLAARAKFYSQMVQNGLMTRNEIRALENLNAKVGADELTVQSNMIDLDQLIALGGEGGTMSETMAKIKDLGVAA